jgi:hypothetical protein
VTSLADNGDNIDPAEWARLSALIEAAPKIKEEPEPEEP